MKMQNPVTGDVLELPLPNEIGEAVVLLNGVVVERALFSDAPGSPAVTLGNGQTFVSGNDFADYLMAMIAPKPAQKGDAQQ